MISSILSSQLDYLIYVQQLDSVSLGRHGVSLAVEDMLIERRIHVRERLLKHISINVEDCKQH